MPSGPAPANPPPATPAPANSIPAAPAAPAPAAPATPSPAAPAAPGPGKPAEQAAPPSEASTGETVELAGRPFAYVEGKADRDEIYHAIRASLDVVRRETDKAGLKPAGKPIAVFVESDDSGFRYHAGIPLDAAPDGKTSLSDSVKLGLTPGGKAMRFQHLGAYADIDATYDAITAYLDEKGIDAQDFVRRGIRERREGPRGSQSSGRHLRHAQVSVKFCFQFCSNDGVPRILMTPVCVVTALLAASVWATDRNVYDRLGTGAFGALHRGSDPSWRGCRSGVCAG